MSLKFRKPSKMLVISDPIWDLRETYRIIKQFKLHEIQPGFYIQHSSGDYEEVFATNISELIQHLEDKDVFISTAQRPEDISAGSTLGVAFEKLQEYGLTFDIGEGDKSGRIIIAYDPDLEYLHSSENDDYLD